MEWIPGGEFLMGSEGFYPEEAPVHRVRVDGFWIDRHPVTNAQYATFVSETGYETVAERPLDPADCPSAPEEVLVPGSLVFHGTPGPVRTAPSSRQAGSTRTALPSGRSGLRDHKHNGHDGDRDAADGEQPDGAEPQRYVAAG